MAVNVSAFAHVNGTAAAAASPTPTAAEEDVFYSQILQLRDAVVAGQHPRFKLPLSAIEQLRATIAGPESPLDGGGRADLDGANDAVASDLANGTHDSTNHNQQAFAANGLPGLSTFHPTASSTSDQGRKPSSSAALDPIFLEKSDSLVRAEGQLKRQRIERDLLDQWKKRTQYGPGAGRDKDTSMEMPSQIDNDKVLSEAFAMVKPVSGLKRPVRAASVVSSFDENDYYSSQVQSALTADFDRLGEPTDDAPVASASSSKRPTQAAVPDPTLAEDHDMFDDLYEPDDDDDEYLPPEPAATGPVFGNGRRTEVQPITPDDDDSDYEPGEIAYPVPAPGYLAQARAQPSPRVPIIRNQLTHIAAPQPNRVSPLAMQKGPSLELELVNGRPEVIRNPQKRAARVQSRRPSSASQSGNGGTSSNKKKKNKKRKRDQEIVGRSKRRRDRQSAQSPPSPMDPEPYIKREPVSPPPFQNVPEVQGHAMRSQHPAEIDLVSPKHAPPQQYLYNPVSAHEPPRYDYAQPRPPAVVRAGSAAGYRPVHRDTQDLRRVASLHHAQRPISPPQQIYSPGPQYRTTSVVYQEPPRASVAPQGIADPRYRVQQEPAPVRYVLAERSPSPIRLQDYRPDMDERAQSPALMPPPVAPPRRIVMDQYGNRYYAADPAPQASTSRASMAPVSRRPEEIMYDRAPSRMSVAHMPPPPAHYEAAESRMPPPPLPPVRREYAQEPPAEYADPNGYRMREYSTRPVERVRYVEEPTSPVYQNARDYGQMAPPPAPEPPREVRYEQMPPPPPPQAMREATVAPAYGLPRAYSVRPEDHQQQAIAYTPRQASVAPMQYVRQEAPMPPPRAVSVVPGSEYGVPSQDQRVYSYAPQPQVRYVDQYGREVEPQQVRAYRY